MSTVLLLARTPAVFASACSSLRASPGSAARENAGVKVSIATGEGAKRAWEGSRQAGCCCRSGLWAAAGVGRDGGIDRGMDTSVEAGVEMLSGDIVRAGGFG